MTKKLRSRRDLAIELNNRKIHISEISTSLYRVLDLWTSRGEVEKENDFYYIKNK